MMILPRPRPLACSLVALSLGLTLAAGCAEDPNQLLPGGTPADPGERSETGGGGGEAKTPGGGGGTTPTGPDGPGTEPGSNPGPEPCKPGLTSVALGLTPSPSGPVRASVTSDGGTLVAWSSGGQIRVRRLDASGAAVGADRSVAGSTVHGVAPTADGVALLVARAPDVLALVKLTDAGGVGFDEVIVGNVDHGVVGNEWFQFQPQFFQQAGRLVASGGKLFAYAPIYRRWPDQIAHTGDKLRVFDAATGNAVPGGWDWGCSHSLDVRLSSDGSKPVCLSDCYPQKGILLNKSTVLSSEPSGNCAGTSGARLGGLAEVGGSHWLTFASREGRDSRDVALVKLGGDTKRYLTEGGNAEAPHLAAFGDGMLAGWRIGNASKVQRLDAQGEPVGAPEDVSATPFGDSDDFLSWPSGDAGWLSGSGGWKLVRVGACE